LLYRHIGRVALVSGTASGGGTALSLKSLARETFIVFGRPHTPSTMQTEAVVAACQAAGFSPRVGHVVPNILSRLNLVAAGLGITIIAASLQRLNVDGVVYRRLKGAKGLKVQLNLASRRGDASAVVRNFLKYAKRTVRNFCEDVAKTR